jgi:hypothetical protein
MIHNGSLVLANVIHDANHVEFLFQIRYLQNSEKKM